jgi:hypothetical protein
MPAVISADSRRNARRSLWELRMLMIRSPLARE